MDKLVKFNIVVDQFHPVTDLSYTLDRLFDGSITFEHIEPVKGKFNNKQIILATLDNDINYQYMIETFKKLDFDLKVKLMDEIAINFVHIAS